MMWLRLYSEARTDNKLRMLTDAQHRVWFNLLCYAGEQDERGVVACDRFLLAVECAGGDEALLAETVALLCRLGILADHDGTLRFAGWDRRQHDKQGNRGKRHSKILVARQADEEPHQQRPGCMAHIEQRVKGTHC